ncbi:Rv3235 family protein [Pseudofrankia inefficax]|uniref:Uncharacterized protein n=1 Tax=Pseudofrankia inefficax (strain DSM 45817 / CECT 9037 / DDB 130130 / EuI1c) TaxID=298654 RepID=E3J0W1_PSEI1|nr:Rv3235 family protein [Pseudofrankia inefficax]ADP84025.1 hypothetical protein FraEuI1c_6041 [Pseudofrankia inefficax]
MTTPPGSGWPARSTEPRRALRGLPAFATDPPYDDELSDTARPRDQTAGPDRTLIEDPPRAAGQAGRRTVVPGARRGTGTASSSRGRGGRHGTGPSHGLADSSRGPGDSRPPTPTAAADAGSARDHPRTTDDAPFLASSGRTMTTTRRAPTRIPQQARDSRFRESPGPAATIVVRAIVEVLAGVRPVAHLAGWATPQLQTALERFGGQYPGRSMVRSIRISEPRAGVAEVVAVISRTDRVAALALRMETTDGRWQVTALQIG